MNTAPKPTTSTDYTSDTVSVRLPPELLKAIDAEAARLAPPGVTLTRSDAVRSLLTRAVNAGAALR